MRGSSVKGTSEVWRQRFVGRLSALRRTLPCAGELVAADALANARICDSHPRNRLNPSDDGRSILRKVNRWRIKE
jgi:hypothetical protein